MRHIPIHAPPNVKPCRGKSLGCERHLYAQEETAQDRLSTTTSLTLFVPRTVGYTQGDPVITGIDSPMNCCKMAFLSQNSESANYNASIVERVAKVDLGYHAPRPGPQP